jgi:hypothetical protein
MPVDVTTTPEETMPTEDQEALPIPPAPPPCLTDFQIVGDNPAEFFDAFAKAQAAYGAILKDEEGKVESSKANYKYNYATLDGTLEATRKALNDQGLTFFQPWTMRDGICVVRSIVAGKGARLEAITTFDATEETGYMSKWQQVGSAITYCRRYSAQALLGVAPKEDDDGKSAPAPTNRQAPPPTPTRQSAPVKPAQPRQPKPQPAAPARGPEDEVAAAMLAAQAEEEGSADAKAGMQYATPQQAVAQPDPLSSEPAQQEPSYLTDDKVRTEMQQAMPKNKIPASFLKRHLHAHYNILPADIGTKLTISQAKEVTAAMNAAPPCRCGKPVCEEPERLYYKGGER